MSSVTFSPGQGAETAWDCRKKAGSAGKAGKKAGKAGSSKIGEKKPEAPEIVKILRNCLFCKEFCIRVDKIMDIDIFRSIPWQKRDYIFFLKNVLFGQILFLWLKFWLIKIGQYYLNSMNSKGLKYSQIFSKFNHFDEIKAGSAGIPAFPAFAVF